MMNLRRWITLAFLTAALSPPLFQQSAASHRWDAEKARAWHARQPWIVGCNFIPSSAINQLEMWQAETFDSVTIDRELGWASSIGFNAVRVFLHVIPWNADSTGLYARIDTYLGIVARHGIRTMFVLFDDCWNNDPQPGLQPAPKPGVHNSGWMQCPGQKMLMDSTAYPLLLRYTRSILSRYSNDKGVFLWDLYNEPGNSGYGIATLPLLTQVMAAARSVGPTQPISLGVWMPDEGPFKALNEFQLANSDIVTFHSYADSLTTARQIRELRSTDRPLICTEYMARQRNSRFATHVPLFKSEDVGAINWGCVSGKTNTIFPWNSKPGSPEPAEWFHDIFHPDGTPYRNEEVALIKRLTKTTMQHTK